MADTLTSKPTLGAEPQAWPALQIAQTPTYVRRLTRLLLAAVVATPVILVFVPWRQNVQGKGRAVAYAPLERQQSVEAPIEGRVVQWWVVEGSEVAEGDPLFEITDNDPQLIARLEDQLVAAESKQTASEAKAEAYAEQMKAYADARRLAIDAARERVAMAKQRIEAAARAVEAAEVAKQTARLNLTRREALRRDGLVSERDLELARLDARKTAADLERARAALSAAKSDELARKADQGKAGADFDARIRSAQAMRDDAAGQAAEARSKALEAEVKIARQRTQRVTAPVAGSVLRLSGNRGGEMVKQGDPLVVIVPNTESMAVELWVDGNDMPLLSTGRKVRLQLEGWPAVQFAGWPSVAVGTFGGIVKLIDATDDGTGRFRIVVLPDPDDASWPSSRFLRQGVRAKGWILLENVTLGWELWRQINGFPPVIADAEPQEKVKIKAK